VNAAALRRALALAVLPALAGGCFAPTWRALPPGAAPPGGTIVLVGRISLVPPLGGRAPASGEVLPPEEALQVAAFFTADLSERFDRTGERLPLRDAWSAWIPLDTWFFVEVPRRSPVYLRGLLVPGAVGTAVEAPARIPLASGDRVAYMGDLTVVRDAPPRLSLRRRTDDARHAAEVLGHGGLLAVPWAVRLAVPEAAGR
jgi:hypothetical protein